MARPSFKPASRRSAPSGAAPRSAARRTIRRTRQRLRADSGRDSTISTVSPILHCVLLVVGHELRRTLDVPLVQLVHARCGPPGRRPTCPSCPRSPRRPSSRAAASSCPLVAFSVTGYLPPRAARSRSRLIVSTRARSCRARATLLRVLQLPGGQLQPQLPDLLAQLLALPCPAPRGSCSAASPVPVAIVPSLHPAASTAVPGHELRLHRQLVRGQAHRLAGASSRRHLPSRTGCGPA